MSWQRLKTALSKSDGCRAASCTPYNLAIAPVLLFSTRAIASRRGDGAGICTGVAVMVPAVLFHVSYAVGYPAVLDEPVPNYWMMSQYTHSPVARHFPGGAARHPGGDRGRVGAGGLIERIEAVLKPGEDDTLGHPARAAIAIVALGMGGLLGSLGIVALVAKGYSALSVGFALVYIIPICTLGIVKIIKSS